MFEADEFYCPNCGAILNHQYGFDPDDSTWTCTECGKHLYDDDIYDGDLYPGVMWYCDECDSLLNEQAGFADYYGTWECTECGHVNEISDDQVYHSKIEHNIEKMVHSWFDGVDDSDADDDEDEDANDVNFENSRDNNDDSKKESHHGGKKENNNEEVEEKLSAKLVIIAAIVIFAVLASCAGWEAYNEVKAPLSSKQSHGLNYEVVMERFQDAGFQNIIPTPVEDLNDGWLFKDTNKENTVATVEINGKSNFKADQTFRRTDTVRIRYHVYPSDE